ncbi:MAG: hypothetical protein M1824_002612 [Vezdaea acicularis]|nr:MAG: hypothetical protein M1824_002612 [Vezdaea acicularis]
MKLIIAGATGFVGKEVVRQCAAHPDVTSAVVLSRRALPDLETYGDAAKKFDVVIVEDFLNYSPHVIEKIGDADGAIWSLAEKAHPFHTSPTFYTVNVDYTLHGATQMSLHSHPRTTNHPFRFAFCSGLATELDQNKRLLWGDQIRKVKGRVEAPIFEMSNTKDKDGERGFSAYSLRPGGILSGRPGVWERVMGGLLPSVGVEEVAACLVDVALHGNGGREEREGGVESGFRGRILENGELARRGKEILARQKR